MKTWLVDIDGTIVEHRSNKEISWGSSEVLLPGSKDFLEEKRINGDQIILTTARPSLYREQTEEMLKTFAIPYDEIIFDLSPYERILINDIKPIGAHDNGYRKEELYTAHAINVKRNEGLEGYRRWIPRFTWSYKRKYTSNTD